MQHNQTERLNRTKQNLQDYMQRFFSDTTDVINKRNQSFQQQMQQQMQEIWQKCKK